MAKIQIPKGLLIGLTWVAVVSALGVVFLLGRESGRKTQTGFQKESRGAGVPVATLIPSSNPAKTEAPIPQSAPGGTPGPNGGVLPIALIPPSGPERAAVAAYFQTVENIQPGSSGDPESTARQVVTGLSKGDTSGFDGMIQQAQVARNRLSAITPPQPCAAYHRESLESLDAGLDLMRDMKKDLSSPGQEASAINLAERANALKARTEALQLQEKSLKQRFGLMK